MQPDCESTWRDQPKWIMSQVGAGVGRAAGKATSWKPEGETEPSPLLNFCSVVSTSLPPQCRENVPVHLGWPHQARRWMVNTSPRHPDPDPGTSTRIDLASSKTCYDRPQGFAIVPIQNWRTSRFLVGLDLRRRLYNPRFLILLELLVSS